MQGRKGHLLNTDTMRGKTMLMIRTNSSSRHYLIGETGDGRFALELVSTDVFDGTSVHLKVGTYDSEADAVLKAWMHCTEHGYTIWVDDDMRCPTE